MSTHKEHLPDHPSPTHAGAVAYRMSEKGARFLVISSSDGRHWVLPKGHVDPGESVGTAALRELREETGVLGEIRLFLSEQRFATPSGQVSVHYFLVERTGETQPAEERKLLWVDGHTALDLLSFENTREAVREAIRRLAAEEPR
jgi:8-oxo-dGTP pyrophosphatase MutT (NUDIX family)